MRSILSAAIRAADAPEILDQRQAQHDRDRPQLAQLEGGDRLVGGDETAEAFRIDPSVAVRDRFERDVVHARKPGRWAVRQARQLPAVPLGQVSLGRADLLFDQIEIIEQPFAGRRDPAVRLDRLCQQIADSDQDVFILSQPAQQLVRSAVRAQLVQASQGLAVLLHLIGAEELRTQRWLAAGVFFR